VLFGGIALVAGQRADKDLVVRRSERSARQSHPVVAARDGDERDEPHQNAESLLHMLSAVSKALSSLAANPATSGIFMDFDGTLSDIVPRPEDAQPVAGALDLLKELAARFAVVAIVSGRSLDDLASRVTVDDVLLAGSYGRERSDGVVWKDDRDWTKVEVEAIAAVAPLSKDVMVERKASGVALHYRSAPHLKGDVAAIAAELATPFALEVKPGRMVFELVTPGPGKGDAVLEIAADRGLERALVAGDDWGDLEAFLKLRASGLETIVVAVASSEAPPSLTDVADVIVRRPADLVTILRDLVDSVGSDA
jgi:trehalose 6-phosphate phosphatase